MKTGFTRKQQPEFRTLVAVAWIAHCLHESLPKPTKQDRDWYEQELFAATGKTSTSDCDPGRDYDRAMAHFEVLSGSGIKWQMRIHSGDAKRVLHELRADVGTNDIDEDYLRGVAKRMLTVDYLPELETLSRPQLILILGEVKRFVRRNLRKEKAASLAAGDRALFPAMSDQAIKGLRLSSFR